MIPVQSTAMPRTSDATANPFVVVGCAAGVGAYHPPAGGGGGGGAAGGGAAGGGGRFVTVVSLRVAAQTPATTSTISAPAAVGFMPTCAPASRSASILACAVPFPPETIAPAWPIFFPAGAVTPAM